MAETYQECLQQLKEGLSLVKYQTPGAASYERGFVAGQMHEAQALMQKLDYMEEQIKDQLFDYVVKESKKDAT